MVLLVAGCTDDEGNTPEIIPEPEKSIQVDKPELSFPRTGGSAVLNITTENVESWDAYSDISWIELGEPDIESGTLSVTVAATEKIEDMEGEIVIHTVMEEVIRIKVKQDGNGIIYDRSSSSRLGFHGDVKSVEFYCELPYVWEYKPSFMYDLEFDRNGMLTHFRYFEFEAPSYIVNFTADLEYDDDRRLAKMDVKSDVNVPAGGPYEFSLTFEYGDHGKYIETDQLFTWLSDRATYTTHRTWLPRMMKNLTKVSVHNTVTTPNDFCIAIDVTGETGTGTIVMTDETGTEKQMHLYDYVFDGKFTQKIIYPYFFISVELPFMHVYEVEQKSGYITRLYQTAAEDDIGLLIFDKYYDTDLKNSLYRYEDALDYMYSMNITYNENFDIEHIEEINFSATSSVEYDYDEHNNWTDMHLDITPIPYHGNKLPTSRTVTYWE